jgi:MFS family permease
LTEAAMMRAMASQGSGRRALLRQPHFGRFLVGQTISFVGDGVTDLAMPLAAVIVVGATAQQMGFLAAASNVPFALVGLLAGVWVDRLRRRPILIACDLVSAVAVGSVPMSYALGALRIEQLYLVAFVLGFVHVISTVAYQSFVPSLVGRDDLLEANSTLEASNSIALMAGPSLAGALVQALTAPLALILDGLSFLVSAVLLRSIRVVEPPPIPAEAQASAVAQIREGMRLVVGHPVLRALVGAGVTHNFFARFFDALFVLYATRELGVPPVALGFVIAAVGPGALLGAVAAKPLAARIGVGPVIVVGQAMTGVARLFVVLAGGPAVAAVVLLALGGVTLGFARTIFNVTQVSLRLAITEDRMHGRVNATMRFLMWTITPLSAVLGGWLATTVIGIRGTLVIAAIGAFLAVLPLLVGPLRRMRRAPTGPGAGA